MSEVNVSRKRVGDDVVLKALVAATGTLTMQELADNLSMKESTLRAQILRIKNKVTEQAKKSETVVTFPTVKDGRVATSNANAEALLSILS